MRMHKNTRLTPHSRREIWNKYRTGKHSITGLAAEYKVSRPTLYKVIQRARGQEFSPRKSTRHDYMTAKYGIRRLAKVEQKIEAKLRKQAKRYNKNYPGEMLHFDTKRLPFIKGEDKKTTPAQYLFVAVDDYSRELYAAILPDKTQASAAVFLKQVIEQCPYTIECAYSDNGTEYKGTDDHDFVRTCAINKIAQRFTKVKRPQTNGKAERVIRTLLEGWHQQYQFKDRQQRQLFLNRFINFYNTVKPHKGIDNKTPFEYLNNYFNNLNDYN